MSSYQPTWSSLATHPTPRWCVVHLHPWGPFRWPPGTNGTWYPRHMYHPERPESLHSETFGRPEQVGYKGGRAGVCAPRQRAGGHRRASAATTMPAACPPATSADALDLYTGPHAVDARPDEWFLDRWEGKLYEVVDGYRPDLIWFDFGLGFIREQRRKRFLAYYYNKEREWGNRGRDVRRFPRAGTTCRPSPAWRTWNWAGCGS